MPAPQFVINYCGVKYRETKELEKYKIDYTKYDTIIEPFGGSFGFIRYIHEKQDIKNKRFIIYDADEELIKFYKFIQGLIKDKTFDDFIKQYNNQMDDVQINCNYKGHPRFLDTKIFKSYLENIENNQIKFMVKKNCMRGSNNTISYKKNCGFLELIEKCEFICCKFEDIDISEYDKEKTLWYLDPPYLSTSNTEYAQFDFNTLFKQLINMFKQNFNIIFIHQDNFLLSYIFKDWFHSNYGKTYGSGKKKEHTIFTTIM